MLNSIYQASLFFSRIFIWFDLYMPLLIFRFFSAPFFPYLSGAPPSRRRRSHELERSFSIRCCGCADSVFTTFIYDACVQNQSVMS